MIITTETRRMKVEMREAKDPNRRVTSNDDLGEDFLQDIVPITCLRVHSKSEFELSDERLDYLLDWGGEYAFVFRTGSKHELYNPNGEMREYYFCKEIL